MGKCYNWSCPFRNNPGKVTDGCLCAETCPGFTGDHDITYSDRTELPKEEENQ